jgi:hypothetical protein
LNEQDEQQLQRTEHEPVVAEMCCLKSKSAIGFAAVSNASNGDDVLAGLDKENAVVAAAETKAYLWWL